MLTTPPPLPWNGSKYMCTHRHDITEQTTTYHAHTIGCRHHTACPKRLNTHEITQGVEQLNVATDQSQQATNTLFNQPDSQPYCTIPHHTPPHDTRPHHMTTQHTTRHVLNTPCHCTVQHTIADHTPQQTTTQCHVVWCGGVRYRAIGLPVWLVEWCVACLARWVVW